MPLLIRLHCLIWEKARANALENAFAYVRFTMYDVRFINNVRIAQNFSNRQRMQGLLYNHQRDECLLS